MPEFSRGAPCPRLPSLFRVAGSRFPVRLLCPFAERLLNQVLAESLLNGELAILETRELALRVDDLGIQLGFTLHDGRLYVAPPREPAAMVSGTLAAFAWLAAGESDADALFFNRHLLMEGDTELGLVIKNVLDAADLSTLPAILHHSLGWLVRAIPAHPPGRSDNIPASPYQ